MTKLTTPKIEISEEDKAELKATGLQIAKKVAVAAAITVGIALAVGVGKRLSEKTDEEMTEV